MKTEFKESPKSRLVLTALAVLTVPLTLFAVTWDDEFRAWVFGEFGASNYYSPGVTATLAVGYGNGMFHNNSAAVGQSLLTYSPNSLVVGKWNEYAGPDALFMVGRGTGLGSPPDKENAFVVLANGDVIIPKAQGDILMGIYGN